jgi:hypothetical protein
MEQTKERWYFETWSPQDGIAFASRRVDQTGLDGNASVTVSLVPPYWRPCQVTPATARRAERQSFQVGFLDGNRQPIGFDTLAELIAVIRQAYLGSGSGPAGEGEGRPSPDGLPPMPDEPGVQEWGDALEDLLNGPGSAEMGHAVASRILNRLGHYLDVFFAYFGRVSLEAMTRAGETDVRQLLWWMQTLVHMGSDVHEVHNIVQQVTPAYPFPMWFWGFPVETARARPDRVFAVPDPLEPVRGQLGETLCYFLASRGRFEAMQFSQFALLIFASAAIVANSKLLPVSQSWNGGRRLFFQQEGVSWLYRQVPSVPSQSDAGSALHGYRRP